MGLVQAQALSDGCLAKRPYVWDNYLRTSSRNIVRRAGGRQFAGRKAK